VAARKSKRSAFVVFYGNEDYYLDRDRDQAKLSDRACEFLDGSSVSAEEVVSACETRTFDGGDRIVVVDNAEKVKDKGVLATYIKDRDASDNSVILVAIIRKATVPKVWEAAAAKGRLTKRTKPAPWKTDEIENVIRYEADRLRIKLAKEIPGVLIRFLGDDLKTIVNELKKFELLVGEGGTVTKKHVQLVLAWQTPAEPWQVGDAVVEKNVRKAMNLVSLLYRYMGDGASVSITYALMRQVERLIIARQMVDKGDDPKVIAERLDMKPSVFEYRFLPQVKRHSVRQLRQHMKTLCRLDTAVKGSARSKRTQVELAVLSIAA